MEQVGGNMPVSKINPDGTVKIYNKNTGQELDVKPEKLGEYSGSLVKEYQEIQTNANSLSSGDVALKDIPSGSRTGAIQALEASKKKILSPEDKVTKRKEDERNRSYGVLEKDVASFEQNFKEAGLKGKLLSALPANTGLSPESADFDAQRDTMAYSLAKSLGEQSGQGVSDKDIAKWLTRLPSRSDTDKEAQLKIDNIYKDLSNRKGGKPLKSGLTDSENKEDTGIGGLLQNAKGDAKDLLNSILNLPGQAVQGLQETATAPFKQGGSPQDLLQLLSLAGNVATGNPVGAVSEQMTKDAVPGMISGVNETLGRPLEGGDVAGRIGENAYKNPVDTLLALSPLLATKGLRGAKAVAGGETGALEELKILQQSPSKSQNLIRQGVDLGSGAGSKEYIARQAVSKNTLPQNQVLLDEGILLHPSETGKIQATSKAMEKYGTEIGNAYKDSDRVFKGDVLGKKLDEGLKEQGYDKKSIDFIKNYINQQGSFDLGSGDNIILTEKAWTAAKNLEKNPPKMMKNPESAGMYKQLSGDAARILRNELAEKVPEIRELNARYSALRDYMDKRLSTPEGLGMGQQQGVIGKGVDIVKDTGNAGANALYKILGVRNNKIIRDNRYKQGNFTPRK